jgi:hypothetical protein
MVIAGCGAASAPDAAAAADKNKTTKDTKAAKPPVVKLEPKKDKAPAPKAAEGKPSADAKPAAPVGDKQLALNGRFEEWSGELPASWSGTKGMVAKCSDGAAGSAGVELKESKDIVLLQQAIKGAVVGKKILVSAKIKAPPRGAVLKAEYALGAEVKSERAVYAGNGDWKVTSFEMTIPKDADPKSLRVQLLRHPGTKGQVFVDDVAVLIER